MNIYFLGTCSGTEPLLGACHQSMAVECSGSVYFFDAGENCSRTAYLSGIDLLSVRAIFISHTHMDHVGGLGNLLWNMRKIHYNLDYKEGICKKTVFIPNINTYNSFINILKNTEDSFNIYFELCGKQYSAGLVYSDENIRVTAFPTAHMGDNPIKSYCFLIECEGKNIVYSGDLSSLSELDAPISKKCDALICETGHIKASDVCEYARGRGVKRLYFTHNNRRIVKNPEIYSNAVKNIFGSQAYICSDGMMINL